jgi:glycosyltransferase involved in cell wall biosynthesis
LKPKLLIIASLFFPQKKSGGPPVSIRNLVEAISPHFDINVITKNHEIGEKKPLNEVKQGWNTFDFGNVYYVNYGDYKTSNILKIIKSVNPDLIYQNSFFSYDDLLPLIIYCKKINPKVKIILNPRGEFLDQALDKKRKLKMLYIIFMRSIGLSDRIIWQVASSNEAKNIAHYMKTNIRKIKIIPNITSVKKDSNLKTNKSVGNLKLVYIARIHPHKNLKFAIESLKNVECSIDFDIYGSIEDEKYWAECLNEISKLPKNVKCEYKGYIENKNIPQALENHHLLYLPSYSEAYGQSIVESMLSSTPVLISGSTPWSDIENFGAGYVCDISSVKNTSEIIEYLAGMDNEEYGKLVSSTDNYINKKLDFKNIEEQYVKLFKVEINYDMED